MTSPGKIEFRKIENPAAPGVGEVKLQIRRIGVCGSDIHVYHGKHPFTPYPVVQGHEYCGEVIEVGEGVRNIKVGDKATARPQQVCGVCAPCRRGDYNICNELKVEGFQAPGTAQDYFIVPAERVVTIPDSISYDFGAMVEPCAVGAHSTSRVGDLRGKNVLVTGAGPIGNLVAQFSKARGAAKVVVTDISEFRLKKVVECGIGETINVMDEDMISGLENVFGEQGFDVGFECAGLEGPLNDQIQNINKGGTIVAVAVYEEPPRVDVSILGDRELSLVGTLMYKKEDYVEAVNFIESEKIKLGPLVTDRFDFEEYLEAYKHIDKKGDKTLKVMIDL